MSATILFTHDPLCFKCCSFKEELWYFETWAYINVYDTITERSTLKSLQRGGVTVVTVSRLSKIS